MTWREDLEIRSTALDRRLVDDTLYAYEDWLEECVRVRNAYTRWSHPHSEDVEPSFAAYLSALDAEERAAEAFRDTASRLRRAAIHRTSAASGG